MRSDYLSGNDYDVESYAKLLDKCEEYNNSMRLLITMSGGDEDMMAAMMAATIIGIKAGKAIAEIEMLKGLEE